LLNIESDMRRVLLPIIVMSSLFSCASQEICDGNNQSELVARFKREVGGSAADTILVGISVHGIRPGKTDSLLYEDISASRIVLPLDPNQPFSTFVIGIDTLQDTLAIHYQTEYYLISYTCGFAALFTLEEIGYSGSLIDRVEVIEPLIDADLVQNEEHIWIYF
jgi:hypothetical protein